MNNGSSRSFAVITGASSGIGFELARQFAMNNFDVLIVADTEKIHGAAAALQEYGGFVEALQIDLADYDGVEELYDAIQTMGRPVDAVAINAGVGVWGDFTRQTDLQDELNLIDLNITSAVHLSKRLLPDMVARRSGRILFTASIAATMPGPLYAVYAASKSFLLSFSEALRNELKDTGVSVTALMPGATETNFFHRAGMENTEVGQAEKDDPADVAREGFEALMAGDDKVVAGAFKNKVQTTMANVLPDTVTAGMHRKQLEPVTDEKS
jgi:short-subunit dehydrogenase